MNELEAYYAMMKRSRLENAIMEKVLLLSPDSPFMSVKVLAISGYELDGMVALGGGNMENDLESEADFITEVWQGMPERGGLAFGKTVQELDETTLLEDIAMLLSSYDLALVRKEYDAGVPVSDLLA